MKKNIQFLSLIIITILTACSNPVEEVKQANTPADLRVVWDNYSYLRQDASLEADEFNEILNQKVENLVKNFPIGPDTKFLLKQRKEELSMRPIQYNIIIVPDLSSRIDSEVYPLQAKQDIKVIESILNLYEELVGQKYIGQKDRIILRPTDKSQIYDFGQYADHLNLDLSSLNLAERRSYLDSLPHHKETFMSTVQKMYTNVQNEGLKGADIWRFFNEDIDSSILRQSTETDSVRNIIVLLTDGYIEAGKYGKSFCQKNSCEYLSSKRIQAFRKTFNDASQPWEQIFEKKDFGILPVINKDELKGVEVLALGFGDRNPKTNPTDYVILKKFWDKWFRENGIRGVVDKNRDAIEDSKSIIKHFIEG